MTDKITYKSDKWRVQIAVWDLRGPYAPSDREPLNFSVTVLPASANKFTSFSCGESIYYGPSLRDAALKALRFVAEAGSLPLEWRKAYSDRI